MQFVKDGPDIPERLLQAHEDGRVVFFCGAGISYPAGLPGFKELVEKLSEHVGEPLNDTEQRWFDAEEFDRTMGHFESRIQGGRPHVRQHLRQILAPNLDLPRALTTHHALLTLARQSQGTLRIVTTNFDTLFEVAREKCSLADFAIHPDPPGRNRWDGLVYLHGRMPPQPSPDDLDRLILSDSDFGQAYLTEAWAARFLANLFRDNVICFVGYRVEDPVLRYMTTAQAVDERALEMFAFAEFGDEADRDSQAKAWDAKHITPMLYQREPNHRNLHRSLQVWASVHRDGVTGRERSVARYAGRDPRTSGSRNDFVGRMLWALGDKSGLPAKRFADMNPVPPLEWLEVLGEQRYGYGDLIRFGVTPHANEDKKLKFGLLSRPAPYHLAPPMAIVEGTDRRSGWDHVMLHLARWMTRHLDDPRVLLWLVRQGGQLHEALAWDIERRLDELENHERNGNVAALENIRATAPRPISGQTIRTLWRLLLAGRIKSSVTNNRSVDLFRWMGRLKRSGLSTALRLELRDLLAPRVLLHTEFRWRAGAGGKQQSDRYLERIEWDLVLATAHSGLLIRDRVSEAAEAWNAALPALLSDFSTLLRDALDLMRELGRADGRSDSSYIHQPSISPHPQNRGFHGWTILIELARDAWLATAEQSPERAVLEAEIWWQTPYPVFRRLAFFAAAQGCAIPLRKALDWLLADDGWWLWSPETRREAIRLLVSLALRLDATMRSELEQAILAGPPWAILYDGIEEAYRAMYTKAEVWLRLAKIAEAGGALGVPGREKLDALSGEYPEWKLKEDQRDEFRSWVDGPGPRESVPTPRRRRELVAWLKEHPTEDSWDRDDWRERCRDNFSTTACALYALSKERNWPVDRWRDALGVWSDEKHLKRSWRYLAPVVMTLPDELLSHLGHQISWWLEAVAKTFVGHDTVFFALIDRVLALDHRDGVDVDDPVNRAINHPVGQVTGALLHWWWGQSLEDGQGLPDEIKPRFSRLCATGIDKYRHGRVVLATETITLFRVDPEWATEFLLPLFDWQCSIDEARAAWTGFLRSPRLYLPLMELLKSLFLDTACHYSSLGEWGRSYASLLTFTALNRGDLFTEKELADATRQLPAEGLREAAQVLVDAQDSAPDPQVHWQNRIAPYLHAIWPKAQGSNSPVIAEAVGRLCAAARDAFPAAVALLRPWLNAVEDQRYLLVHRLQDADLCGRFPESALDFLDAVIGSQFQQYPPNDLKACLDAIRTANSALEADPRYRSLTEYLRQYGIE